jgi:transposase
MERVELTDKERIILKGLHKKNMRAKEADKIKAILLLDRGYSQKEVAEILLIDENTVKNWKEDFLYKIDFNGWLKDNYVGYQGKLNKEEQTEVEKFVENSVVPNSEAVQAFIKDRFGKEYSVSGIVNLLHRLDFVYKDTRQVPSKADIEAQRLFKEAYEIFEKYLPENEVILFGDATHPQHNTRPAKVWVKKGQEKVIKSNTGRQKLNINGLYNPKEQDLIYSNDETVNSQSTIELFKRAEEQYKDKKTIHIFVDNAPYFKSREIQEYLFNSVKIRLRYLPTYSPNLNLIERLWRFLRKKIINLTYYEKFSYYKDAILNFLGNIHQYRDELRQFIGTKLHLLNYQTI